MNNQELAKKWIELKTQEDALKKARLEVENELISVAALEKDAGANNFENILTITTGYDRNWDQDGLAELAAQGIDPFPFKIKYQEQRGNTKALEEMAPDFWEKHYEPLLTVKPKKPSFKVR